MYQLRISLAQSFFCFKNVLLHVCGADNSNPLLQADRLDVLSLAIRPAAHGPIPASIPAHTPSGCPAPPALASMPAPPPLVIGSGCSTTNLGPANIRFTSEARLSTSSSAVFCS